MPKKKTKKKATKKVAAVKTKVAPLKASQQKTSRKECNKMRCLIWGLLLFCVLGWTYVLILYTCPSQQATEMKLTQALQEATIKQTTTTTSQPKQGQRRLIRRVTPAAPAPACPEEVARKETFNAEQYAPYAIKGTAKIVGKACFPVGEKGALKCFEGIDVFINPVTDYSREWWKRGWAGKEVLQPADKRVLPFNKHVVTDKDGNFAFNDLAAGDYYVVTQICAPREGACCSHIRYGAKLSVKTTATPKFEQVFPQ